MTGMTSEVKHVILAETLGKPFGSSGQGINENVRRESLVR